MGDDTVFEMTDFKPAAMTQDYAEAVTWFRRAADQNLAPAQDTLGDRSAMGVGVAKDVAQGLSGIARRPSRITRKAQYHLALSYDRGQGVTKEPAEAYKWSLLAMKQGHEKAKALVAALQKELMPAQIAEGEKRAGAFQPRPAASP